MRAVFLAVLLASGAALAAAQEPYAPKGPYQGHEYPWVAFAARFDGAAPVQLEGRITGIEWANPQSRIQLEVSTVRDGGGGPLRQPLAGEPEKRWTIVVASEIELRDKGVDPVILAAGQPVTVRGYRARDRSCAPACTAIARDITFADGRKAYLSNVQVRLES